MRLRSNWLWLLLVIPAALGLVRLRFDTEVLDLLPANLPVVRGLMLYQQHFANARELIVTVRAGEARTCEETARRVAEALRAQPDLVAQATWQAPWTEHPGQAAEILAAIWLNQPPAEFGELARRLEPGQAAAAFAQAREELATSMSPQEVLRLAYDPLGFSRLPEAAMGAAPAFGSGDAGFSSEDRMFRVIYVEAARELKSYRECDRWWKEVRQVVDQVAGTGGTQGVSIGYTGRPAFVAEIASGMERDITGSVGGTSVIIAGLFWLAHRRWKPMLWLLTLLALILACTLALGALIFGTISVVSMGFAAILLGLAVDYAVVHYQEALAQPALAIPEVRSAIAPSIFWAAATTISAFLVLNFGGLPGLAQLGSLVGLGVGLSACVMIFAFLPPLFPERRRKNSLLSPALSSSEPDWPSGGEGVAAKPPPAIRTNLALAATVGLVALLIVITFVGWPRMDSTAGPLRPRNSPAYATLAEVTAMLNRQREPLWLIIEGNSETEVASHLQEVRPALSNAVQSGVLEDFVLPDAIWPQPGNQVANKTAALQLIPGRGALLEIARTNGFAESALGLANAVFDSWHVATSGDRLVWPTNETSRWILNKVSARTPTNCFALGLLNARTTPQESSIRSDSVRSDDSVSKATAAELDELAAQLQPHRATLSGWQLLGTGVFSTVRANLWKLVVPMVALILLSLGLAFRRWKEVLLSLAVLAMSGVCLLMTMKMAGWSWNLLNLMGLPLILGTGVDYSIFMQLALRRHDGNLAMAHRSVGRALLLCGATAIAGFGSLAWSSNAGMASLGQVCAVGIAGNMLISVLLLPVWWKWCVAGAKSVAVYHGSPSPLPSPPGEGEVRQAGSRSNVGSANASLSRASGTGPAAVPRRRVSLLYRTELWRLGLWVARLLPARFSEQLGRGVARIYWLLAWHRREVVIQNLLPPLNGDLREARKTAKRLFGHFAVKLVDLWRFEAGLPIDPLFGQYTGWEHFLKAHQEKRGVLLLTTHLGNWEFGGPWLTRHGFTLTVITLPEPAAALTQLRQASRAKWDIETLVIGEDPFAFVEIIRRLEAGAVVALLVDRPPARSAVTVELFGRPFEGSIAAAELARASGCALIPVYLPRTATKYEAHVQPPIPYDRAALRSPEARHRLTQQILRAFEEGIRQNLDQWYHFVPIWPRQDGPAQSVQTAPGRNRERGAVGSQSSSPQPSV